MRNAGDPHGSSTLCLNGNHQLLLAVVNDYPYYSGFSTINIAIEERLFVLGEAILPVGCAARPQAGSMPTVKQLSARKERRRWPHLSRYCSYHTISRCTIWLGLITKDEHPNKDDIVW